MKPALDFVSLTRWESRICTWVGRQRYADATGHDRDGGEGPQDMGADLHICGAHCEFAGSIFCNLYWRPTIGEFGQPDIGGLVEVRGTTLEHGRLIVKPKEDDDAPFVLIIANLETLRFRFAGWAFGRDAKLAPLVSEFPAPGGGVRRRDPAHYAGQDVLEPRSTLMAWLKGQVR